MAAIKQRRPGKYSIANHSIGQSGTFSRQQQQTSRHTQQNYRTSKPASFEVDFTLCRSNVKTAYNSNYPKSWLLLLRMVDRDQTNMKLEKKNTFGGSGGPQGAILG